VKPYEVESQLSAMFDGELPAAECELLSRRIDRDESLGARWSRYALIGAAMRSEPVATARSGFAARVSAAVDAACGEPPRHARERTRRRRTDMLWSGALAASLVVAVAGVSISMLRYTAFGSGAGELAGVAPAPAGTPAAAARMGLPPASAAAPPHESNLLASAPSPSVVALQRGGSEPVSYVTPAVSAPAATGLRTQLADFIVAHSEYSTPLMRRNLLSALVSNDASSDTGADSGSPYGSAAGSAAKASAGQFDATTSFSSAGR
jgi:hypothetical protein